MKLKLNGILLTAFATAFIAGCSQEARENYDQAGDKIGSAAQDTGEAVKKDAEVTSEAVANAGKEIAEETKKAAEKAAQVGDALGMTNAVKTAIIAAKDLDAKDLNVDTVNKTVYLKGHVPTAEQKARAEALAKATAGPTYTVQNELTVGG